MSAGYLIDTNVPSELIRPNPQPEVVEWVSSHDDLYLSVVSIGELVKGMELLQPSRRRVQLEAWFTQSLLPLVSSRILPITQMIASRWAVISAQRQLAGKPVSMADGLIAATALEHNLTLVTRNTSDFSGISLPLLNPWGSVSE